jgi:hypothetical protein
MVKYTGICAVIFSSLLIACAGMNKINTDSPNQYKFSMSKDDLVIKGPLFPVSDYNKLLPMEIAKRKKLLYAINRDFLIIDECKNAQLLFYDFGDDKASIDRIRLLPRKRILEKDYGLKLLTKEEKVAFTKRYEEWFDDFILRFLAEFDEREFKYWDADMQILAQANRIKYKIYPSSTGKPYNNKTKSEYYIKAIDEADAEIKSIKAEFKEQWDSPYREECPEWLTSLASKTEEKKMEEVYQMLESQDIIRLGENGFELRRAYNFFYKEIKLNILDKNEVGSTGNNYERIKEVLDHSLYELCKEIIKVIKENYNRSREQLRSKITAEDLRWRIKENLIGIADGMAGPPDLSDRSNRLVIDTIKVTDYAVKLINIDNHAIGTVLTYPKKDSKYDKEPWERMLDTLFTRKTLGNADIVP